jgi:hypothetical protein
VFRILILPEGAVKPLALLKYLITLITPENGIVLDMFAGSGSTGVAAIQTGHPCILVEREQEYVDIIHARIAHTLNETQEAMGQEYICHESCPVRLLDSQSGELHARGNKTPTKRQSSNGVWAAHGSPYGVGLDGPIDPGSPGGASKYFATFPPDSLWSTSEEEVS